MSRTRGHADTQIRAHSLCRSVCWSVINLFYKVFSLPPTNPWLWVSVYGLVLCDSALRRRNFTRGPSICLSVLYWLPDCLCVLYWIPICTILTSYVYCTDCLSVLYWEKISKTIQIFCFFRVSPLGRSFNSSRFGSKCIKPSPHLALTLALTLTLTLKPPPTPTLTLTLPLTLNKKTA